MGKHCVRKSSYYITGPEVAEVCGVCDGKGYEIVRNLNKQPKANGYIVVAGRVPRRFFNEHFYGGIDAAAGDKQESR